MAREAYVEILVDPRQDDAVKIALLVDDEHEGSTVYLPEGADVTGQEFVATFQDEIASLDVDVVDFYVPDIPHSPLAALTRTFIGVLDLDAEARISSARHWVLDVESDSTKSV